MSIEEGLTEIAQDAELVYATTDRELGRVWAGIYTPDGNTFPGGALYRVELDDPQPDDDLLSLTGVSWQARSGRILSVYDAHIPYHDKHRRRLLAVSAAHDAAKRAAAPSVE